MTNKLKVIVITFLFPLVFVGCTSAHVNDAATSEEQVNALIIGSAEHPDPVLVMVQELEKKGILKNVIVRESFPVQIEVTGSKSIIEMLQAIPRKESPNFR